jgi:hypothetical protein
MKMFLRRIKKSLVFRLLYRLVCWINYPTSRERMWHMYSMGVAQGRKMTLQNLPIVQVQPKQAPTPVKVHLPPGEWSRQWREAQVIKSGKNGHENGSGLASEATSSQLINDDSWLNSKPRTPEQEGDPTESMPAMVKVLHERRNAR